VRKAYAAVMSTARRARSFEPDSSSTVTMAAGQIAHQDHVAHSDRLAPAFSEVRPGVWTFVGNGLSNQTFVEGPDGVIAIDTGENIEEMANAIAHLRQHCSAPIVAVLLTHFHYVAGTKAVFEAEGHPVPVIGHERIAPNRQGAMGEVAPAYLRGVISQFGIFMPVDGPDGVVNVGLGRFWTDPKHAPFTPGFVAPTETFGDLPSTLDLAGLRIEVYPAPSDADDSVTYWFPELGLAVNNLVWPVLFNVFAIRGEVYRDPRVLIAGIDQLLGLAPEHLVATHGPPMSGRPEINQRVVRYRDSIQFLWDQSVRATNQGLLDADVGLAVQLPDWCDDDFITSEFYGVAEHHLRQIRTGLFGFFDGDEARLFPLPSAERASRLVAGFGGAAVVRQQMRDALDSDDLRWALELGSWLIRDPDAADGDRQLLALALRTVAARTPAANIRNWCITRARVLDGSLDFSSFYAHRVNRAAVLSAAPSMYIDLLRVTLDPTLVDGVDHHLAFEIDGTVVTGLWIRNSVAVVTNGSGADSCVATSLDTWATVVSGGSGLDALVASGEITITGDPDMTVRCLRAFDLLGLTV